MEIIVIIWIILAFVISVVKKKNAEENKQSGVYRTHRSRMIHETTDRVSAWGRTIQSNINRGTGQDRTLFSEKRQESWRNTANVTRSDITFRGLREGEDELAYLIRKNTAYEKILESRLVSRSN